MLLLPFSLWFVSCLHFLCKCHGTNEQIKWENREKRNNNNNKKNNDEIKKRKEINVNWHWIVSACLSICVYTNSCILKILSLQMFKYKSWREREWMVFFSEILSYTSSQSDSIAWNCVCESVDVSECMCVCLCVPKCFNVHTWITW